MFASSQIPYTDLALGGTANEEEALTYASITGSYMYAFYKSGTSYLLIFDPGTMTFWVLGCPSMSVVATWSVSIPNTYYIDLDYGVLYTGNISYSAGTTRTTIVLGAFDLVNGTKIFEKTYLTPTALNLTGQFKIIGRSGANITGVFIICKQLATDDKIYIYPIDADGGITNSKQVLSHTGYDLSVVTAWTTSNRWSTNSAYGYGCYLAWSDNGRYYIDYLQSGGGKGSPTSTTYYETSTASNGYKSWPELNMISRPLAVCWKCPDGYIGMGSYFGYAYCNSGWSVNSSQNSNIVTSGYSWGSGVWYHHFAGTINAYGKKESSAVPSAGLGIVGGNVNYNSSFGGSKIKLNISTAKCMNFMKSDGFGGLIDTHGVTNLVDSTTYGDTDNTKNSFIWAKLTNGKFMIWRMNFNILDNNANKPGNTNWTSTLNNKLATFYSGSNFSEIKWSVNNPIGQYSTVSSDDTARSYETTTTTWTGSAHGTTITNTTTMSSTTLGNPTFTTYYP